MKKRKLLSLNNEKILTGKATEHLLEFKDSGIFLHKDIISPFLKLQKDAYEAIGADLQIISGHRSYERQLKIWNEKASGKRTLLDKNNVAINIQNLIPEDIVNSILYWSAIPGVSRHHWGTDIDIYDASAAAKNSVKLVSSECEPGGPFKKLHLWLDSYLYTS